MIETLVFALIVAVVVGLVLMAIGRVLGAAGGTVPIIAAIAGFLVQFCWVIGLLAGALYFITGGHWKL